MTGQADEHERTMAFAEIALGQIKTLHQPATPRPLTQLANRKFFDTSVEADIAEARDKNEPLSLLLTHIDYFKKFNDTTATGRSR